MNWSRVIEFDFKNGGFQIYPYQLAVGCSFKYLPCMKTVMFRLYIGPFKLWFNIPSRRFRDKGLPKFKDIIGLFIDEKEKG